MDQGDENPREEIAADSHKCFMTIRFNAESNSRARVLHNSLRVDREPKSVIRELNVDGSSLIINLTSSNLTHLRASSNGILENLKTLMDVIQRFEVAEEYNYSHF